ncbi:MAG TPA: TIGR01777 family oxidoreductase [Candidatus Tumulicola sp.]|nr:TIGR01777 family oxidoreductase [Candidatus Tumulicola sp.]
MQSVVVTGASGFIGKALVAALLSRGDAVTALSRDPAKAKIPPGVRVARFDPLDPHPNPEPFEGQDAVVHLAGESVSGRWTAQKKQAIRESRVVGTRNLVASLAACTQKPRTLVSASAVGYYGSRGDEPLEEWASPGTGFLAEVCAEWEKEAKRAAQHGTRVVLMRQAIVFGTGGGALQEMLPPFRWFAGGPLGNGTQWFPWIHLEDDIALFVWALEHPNIAGAVNAVAPDIANNARVAAAIGHALTRPALAYAPGFALHALLGEFADSLLASQLVLPARASDEGFTFKHDRLEAALLELLAPGSKKKPATHELTSTTLVHGDISRVFEYFSNPANLERITQPKYGLKILTPQPIAMRRGTTIEYRLHVWGAALRWKSLIAEWKPGVEFVDYQLRGPYALWRHRHRFSEEEDGVRVDDLVEYSLPLAPLSGLALPLVRADLANMFSYRKSRLEEGGTP